jgi:hypothetical protein
MIDRLKLAGVGACLINEAIRSSVADPDDLPGHAAFMWLEAALIGRAALQALEQETRELYAVKTGS